MQTGRSIGKPGRSACRSARRRVRERSVPQAPRSDPTRPQHGDEDPRTHTFEVLHPPRGGERRAARPTSTRARTRNPEGGLTAAGRAEYARTEGAHLKPGVTTPEARMTSDEMRRKGSWATRFHCGDTLPALTDARGQPTRFALSAHAWGEKVPTTEAEARRIAERGRALLERYRRSKGD